MHEGAHAYILQNADKRIVFVIPYQERYTLIGTTDVAVEAFEQPEISGDEIDYLLELANTYLAQPLARSDVVWSYSGVRPLYDDGASDPSSITRDYVFKLDTADGARRGRAVDLRRQDHDLSEARRARARRVDAVPAADAAALDGSARCFPEAICRTARRPGARSSSGAFRSCRRA